MKKRREFIKQSSVGLGMALIGMPGIKLEPTSISEKTKKPIIISTWNHGLPCNDIGWAIINKGGSALDAVEKGVMVVESDPTGTSVGLGGAPDRDGHVTLDACIMDDKHNCGGVAFLENIEHPISVARKVMEDTPHVLLVGEGAYEFAREKGFEHKNLLTEESKKRYEKWLSESKYKPIINIENHDTIGALALDKDGNLSGACTTSGLAYKMHGRVGDSPIIGAGLFVDNEVGAACATGVGEAVIRIAGSALVVEHMRMGKSPQEACQIAIERVISKNKNIKDIQVGFLAIDKYGNYGAYSIHEGFNFAIYNDDFQGLKDSEYFFLK